MVRYKTVYVVLAKTVDPKKGVKRMVYYHESGKPLDVMVQAKNDLVAMGLWGQWVIYKKPWQVLRGGKYGQKAA